MAGAIIFATLVGFVLGQLLMGWARTDPMPPEREPEPPTTLLERYHLTAHTLAERAYLAGLRAGVGGKLPPESLPMHRENGHRAISASTAQLARVIAHAHVDGVQALRASLGRRTVLEEYAIDRAVAHTLEEVTS